MDIFRLLHILLKNSIYIILIPILMGLGMYFLSRDMPQYYSSKASVFSGVTSSPSLDNLGGGNVDYFANKAAYNNLLSIISSKKVLKETSIRLLAQHLILEQAVDTIISTDWFAELNSIVPKEVKALVVKGDVEKTYQNLSDYVTLDKDNFIYGLLNYDVPYYSYHALAEIKTQQVGASDIIEILYESEDPGITYQTIQILIEVFLKEYAQLKRNQSDAVVEYFEMQLNETSRKLSVSEDRLLGFNTSNKIINFYEQTKHISSQQEKIEVRLQEILMEYNASEAVLRKLEQETSDRFNISLVNEEILGIRKAIIDVNYKLAVYNLNKEPGSEVSLEGKSLLQRQILLEEDLRTKINKLYYYSHNTDGISVQELLNSWLKAVIDYESLKAQYLAMENRKLEFDKLYAQYAPLGAELKRIERKINVTEEEYLEILHHLGLAKLKQQNQEMMSNMKILDSPEFPIDPQASKRKLYIVIVTLFSGIFILLGLIVFELVDKTIKNAANLAKQSGVETSGIVGKRGKKGNVDYERLNTIGLRPVTEKIINEIKINKAPVIQLISHWPGEGKSYLATLLSQQLRNLGYAVNTLDFSSQDQQSLPSLKSALAMNSYSELIGSTQDITLVEVPSLTDNLFNSMLLASASQTYLVLDVSRTWSKADDFILKNTIEKIPAGFHGILNNAGLTSMEDIVGEIPKKRSWLRRTVKQKLLKRIL